MREDERVLASNEANPSQYMASLAYAAVFMLLGVGGLGLVLGWIFGPTGRLAGYVIGLVLCVAMVVQFIPHMRRQRAKGKADVAAGEVEELQVEATAVGELSPDHSSVAPALVFDIGDGQLLVLSGPWLFDAKTYGAQEDDAFEDDETQWFNRLPPPHAFPSTRFTLVRLPNTGEVLSIDVNGDYLPPKPNVASISRKEHDPRPSEIVAGRFDRFDRIEQALASLSPKQSA